MTTIKLKSLLRVPVNETDRGKKWSPKMKKNQMMTGGKFNAEQALHWHEPYEVVPEMVAAALKASSPYDFYELMDLFGEYNISFALETAGSKPLEPNSSDSEIEQAVKYASWDAFQDDDEIIQFQDYIEEIIGKF